MMVLCHFDIPAKNYENVKKFYHGVFGWKFEKEVGSTKRWSINFESKEQPVLITGGIVPRSVATQPIGCHFLVSSIEESSEKIQAFGGAVFVPKTVVPGKGFYARCLDPENSYFVIWENDKKTEK